ncbi:MAG: M20/M25/M40 family metallo-hydrolase [Chitinophagaceae bacterium]
MKSVFYFFLSCILLSSSFLKAQQQDAEVIKNISNNIFTQGKAYEHLRVLCKEVGPRLSGSEGAARAVKATFEMMKAIGADTVYLQEVMVPHWVRGEKERCELDLGNGKVYPLDVCALGNSEGTGKKGLKAEIVEVNNFEALEVLGAAGVRGKIVFFNHPMNPTYVRTFQAYGEAGQYRSRGPAMAARYGAVGTIVRSLASNIDDFPHTGNTTYNDSFPKIPAIAVSTLDAEYLSAALKKQENLKVYMRNTSTMLPDALSHNVVGELRGSEFPDEVITVGGHLDSWDLAEGAHDDGAGCVQSIEIIRVFKALGIRPKRTIRVVMFMNEENGLRGGRKYAEMAKTENKKFIFALESDAGGFTPRAFAFSEGGELLERLRKWLPHFVPYGITEFSTPGGGADIGPLRPLGTVLCGLQPDSQRYFDHHHAANDNFEAVSKRELELGAINMAALVYLVSQYGL